MTQSKADSRTHLAAPLGLQPLGALPGLADAGLLDGDAAGLCVDGMCQVPGAAEKAD